MSSHVAMGGGGGIFVGGGAGGEAGPGGLQVYDGPPIDADTGVTPGFIYLVAAGTDEIAISIVQPGRASLAGQSVAFRTVGDPVDGADDITIIPPLGSLIEDDEGSYTDEAEIEAGRQAGTYREYICQPDGVTWLLRHHDHKVEERHAVTAFTFRVTSTGERDPEVIAHCQFSAYDWRNYRVRLYAYLSVAEPGQLATLDLCDAQTGQLIATLEGDQTLPTVGFIWFDPDPDAYVIFYELRLRCSGGDAPRAFCQTAGLEARSS